VQFRLWAQEPADSWGQRYQVLHVSAPHLQTLADAGRWPAGRLRADRARARSPCQWPHRASPLRPDGTSC